MNLNSDPTYLPIDGFLLNTNLKYNLTFKSLALQQWDALRRVGSYKTKYWSVPEDSTIVIPAFDSYERQIKAVPGAAIWGFIFTQPINPDSGVPSGGPFSIQIRDSCNDVSLFQEATRCDRFLPTTRQQPLSKLHVVSPPGLLTIEISSQQTTDQDQVQLILCGGEPVC